MYFSKTKNIKNKNKNRKTKNIQKTKTKTSLVTASKHKDNADPAETAFWIAQYIRRVQTLFLEGHCKTSGFTELMLAQLKKPLVYTLKGTALQCGSSSGVPADIVTSCLQTMACWARLAIAAARAEFPDFTVMHAMSAFKLVGSDFSERHTSDSVVQAGEAGVKEKLATLATAFHLNVDDLEVEFARTREIAQGVLPECRNNEREAWRTAILRCESARVKSKFRVDTLKIPVQAWLGWTAGTSNIERAFSLHQKIFSADRRSRMTRQREQDVMTLACDYDKAEVEEVIKLAIEIWKAFYYNVKGPQKHRRIDAGVKRHRGEDIDDAGVETLSRFIKRRRASVAHQDMSSGNDVVSYAKLVDITAGTWTTSMEKEEAHMNTHFQTITHEGNNKK